MRFLLSFLVALVSACATDNPFNVPDDQAAILQNRGEARDDQWYSLLFVGLDGEILKPDAFT